MQSQSKFVKSNNSSPNNNKRNNIIIKSNTNTSTTTTTATSLSSSTTTTTITTSTSIKTTTIKEEEQQEQNLLPPRVRVIKCKEPLINFRFYLDIEDHQLTSRIEELIKLLGGRQDFFLNDSITHFITDKKQTIITTTAAKNKDNNAKTPTTQLLLSIESISEDYKNASSTPTTATTTTTKTTQILQSTTPSKNLLGNRKQQTRADTILNRVRQQQQQQQQQTEQLNVQEQNQKQQQQEYNYNIWNVEYALKFFKKVQHELRNYLTISTTSQQHNKKIIKTKQIKHNNNNLNNNNDYNKNLNGNILLKGNYIKIEAIKPTNCRPYYQLFRSPILDWPKIDINSDEGAFRLFDNSNKNINNNNKNKMTRKSRSRTSAATTLTPTTPSANNTTTTTTTATATKLTAKLKKNIINNKRKTSTPTIVRNSNCRKLKEETSGNDDNNKQCGVCEICKIEYDTLTIHLKTKDHEYFAKNTQNFIALDTLIQATADVKKFLTADNNKTNNLNDLNDDIKIDDHQQPLLLDTTLKDDPLDITTTLTPPLREKSKRITKGKHSSEKFQKNKTTTSSLSPTNCNNNNTNTTNNNNNQNNNNVYNKSKSKSKITLSSPIRAILPTSNLYKVVDNSNKCKIKTTDKLSPTTITTTTTQTPKTSLIVKFKKVRHTELMRLNGEAENFMYPKSVNTSSSDLPTDIDRQTSSDNQGQTSFSLNSSNECQRFPKAPIQSELQLKPRKSRIKLLNELSPPSAAAAIVAASASIRLPAATRKSSRTATAIVTAATTSSRRLLAAVAAVKKSTSSSRRRSSSSNSNSSNNSNLTEIIVKKSNRLISTTSANETTTTTTTTTTNTIKTEPLDNDLNKIVKLKDRVGEIEDTKTTPTTPTTNKRTYFKKPNTYDYRDSIRLKEQIYAFERIPSNDLWHRVFSRQDIGNEEYYSYYGNTDYHKLPYELPAIPYQANDCCLLCKLLNKNETISLQEEITTTSATNSNNNINIKKEEDTVINNNKTLTTTTASTSSSTTTTSTATTSTASTATLTTATTTYKHKKLHLLQRYRQEQADLLKEEKDKDKDDNNIIDDELTNIEPLIRERTNSTASSCCSTNTSIQSKKPFRNKHLNLELPPRKSPREHASTLALVCGIIKQRQESKTNSEIDEPHTGTNTPIPISITIPTTTTTILTNNNNNNDVNSEEDDNDDENENENDNNEDIKCVTPIEEMRFTTEISENVKRMRRGQNKYDHSPNYVLHTNRRFNPI